MKKKKKITVKNAKTLYLIEIQRFLICLVPRAVTDNVQSGYFAKVGDNSGLYV
jgi:hypothetical protein